MNNLKNQVSVTDFKYAKEILELTLLFYKKIQLYQSQVQEEVIRAKLEELSKNCLEQFEQLISILEVQDNE
ncbi:unknown [Firmicutes bacterium CAG:631]|jgi:hypothetical protein|nr:unknown [Firmicutes bacterium CAG:631]